VPVPPGSGVDAVSRSLGAQMAEAMGVPIVTEYKPGASAVVGSDALAKSPPDGYTIMMGYTAHSTNPLFNASMPYDTLRDFTPVIYVCYVPAVLMVHPSTPANTVNELVDMMKKTPATTPTRRAARARLRTSPANCSSISPASTCSTFPTRATRRRSTTCSAATSP